MEEFVGGLWHKFITGTAERRHPQAKVSLAEMEKTAGVLFRAFGGEPGLRVAAAAETRHGARRRLLQRIAGSDDRAAQAGLDGETLQLPPEIALFPERALNRELYLWLIALAAADGAAPPGAGWIVRNQQATLRALARYPGMRPRYARLVEALVAQRIDPLAADEARAEAALRQALREPGSVTALPPASRPPQPVPLWLHAHGAGIAAAEGQTGEAQEGGGSTQEPQEKKRHRARRVDAPEGKNGFLMMFRAESLLSWADFIKVNRPFDDDPNPDAERAANDMDELAVARDGPTAASKVRFDLDLPSAAADDIPLSEGILLPEWDWRRRALKPDHCRVQPLTARDAQPAPLPPRLARPARRLRAQFAALAPQRRWLKNQPDGPEPDIDACVRAHADRMAGLRGASDGGYLAQQPCERDLACLALADLSLSTDAWVGNEHRVIDVVKDSLLLFGEALAATGDRYAFYGFSSLKRGNVRFHHIKSFEEAYGAETRGRIAALKPGYYTRMGAAIRHAASILGGQAAALRLLLILTDGKPNDLDHYDGRYGIEDTRMAVGEARRAGLRPFCITIDREGASYLPHLFGPAGYIVIRQPEELPARLPLLYAQLTAAR